MRSYSEPITRWVIIYHIKLNYFWLSYFSKCSLQGIEMILKSDTPGFSLRFSYPIKSFALNIALIFADDLRSNR